MNGYIAGLALLHAIFVLGALILTRKDCHWFGVWCGWYVATYFVFAKLMPGDLRMTDWLLPDWMTVATAILTSLGLTVMHLGLRKQEAVA